MTAPSETDSASPRPAGAADWPRRLPGPYMVPVVVRVSRRLAADVTGKLDRAQLLTSIEAASSGGASVADAARIETPVQKRTAPQTPVEEVLLGIWTEVRSAPRTSAWTTTSSTWVDTRCS